MSSLFEKSDERMILLQQELQLRKKENKMRFEQIQNQHKLRREQIQMDRMNARQLDMMMDLTHKSTSKE